MSLGVVLACGLGAMLASLAGSFRSARLWLAALMLNGALVLGAAAWALASGDMWEWRSSFQLGGECLHMRMDGVSALFLALVAVVGVAGAAYSKEYWSRRTHPVSSAAGRCWWTALLLSMELLLVCSNGLHFLIAWELFALCAIF